MKLLSISSRNYRTLQDIEIPFSENYCTISGRNNAGKSCIIRLLLNIFRRDTDRPWILDEYSFDYKSDKTQWHKNDDPIIIQYRIKLSKDDDAALISFIEKISSKSISKKTEDISIEYKILSSDDIQTTIKIGSEDVDAQASKEIVKKLKTSNLLFLYNSTTRHEEIYYGRGRARSFYEVVLSEDERKQLDIAGKTIDRKIKKLAREHKENLNSILGKLSERYDVEFSTLEGHSARYMPLGINLHDKNVEVPLNEWGSGTQNRTYILMAILQANRIKTRESAQDKITPIVVIEEPESFLHPSAQAEFGKVIRNLSTELGIQIIVTTHSPYMLNYEVSSSNILLCRTHRRGKPYESKLVDTSSTNWMAPFAEHLGINTSEFISWRPVFSSYQSKVLLVEGEIDKNYFEFIREKKFGTEIIDDDIEIVPYGGKDTLKNTILVKFVLSKFDKVFITFDLDAASDVQGYLQRLDLKETVDFLAVGLNKAGKDAIEGLLPDRILSAVNARETDLVMQLGAQDGKKRKEAKDKLKRKYLEEFKNHDNYSHDELKEISKLIKTINKKMGLPNKSVQ